MNFILRTALFVLVLALGASGHAEAKDGAPPDDTRASDHEVTVYKSPTCGCCNGWIDHLKAAGFQVVAHNTEAMSRIKQDRGVPRKLGSCHTAEVAGYVIEGHVPPADILRLLREKPPIVGLAVPGMPIGSPGMEGPNPERYQVLGFGPDGETSVFSTHTP